MSLFLKRQEELDLLAHEYNLAKLYIDSVDYFNFRLRIYTKIERLILSYGPTTNPEFILGQCVALVHELNRYESIVSHYEAKKKVLDEFFKKSAPHPHEVGSESRTDDL